MSTRKDRAERKRRNESLTISACSYGVHPFVRQELPEHLAGRAGCGTHMHYCPECDASYFEMDPCWCTRGDAS